MLLYISELDCLSQEEYNEYYSLLSIERKTAIDRMRIENDKKRSILGEALARRGISRLCSLPEREIEFFRDERGKPFCINANAYFSISHSKDRVICAVGDSPLGADTEKIRFTEPRVMRACCKDGDFEYILGAGRDIPESFTPEQSERFFVLWTAKEAYCKHTGVGVSGMKSVSLEAIKPNCKTLCEQDFVTSVYCEKADFELETIDLRRGK